MEQRFVFFDLETGGPNPKRHPIVQLAALAVDAVGNAIEAFEAKVKCHPQTANVYSLRKNSYHSGIWAREAREGNEVATGFARFLKRHATHPVTSAQGASYRVAQLVAHHAAFHAAGRHSHVAELLRSGASLPEARELARHSGYSHHDEVHPYRNGESGAGAEQPSLAAHWQRSARRSRSARGIE